MSEELGQPWGMCAAFGCPLLGSLGSEGRWYCFCHVNKPSTFNDAITRELREKQMHLVDSTIEIRRHHSSFHGEERAYRTIQQRLMVAGRKDLLMTAGERQNGGVRAWLMRLERALIDSVSEIGVQKQIPTTVQTADVPNAQPATDFFPPVAERAQQAIEEANP
ncbi:hypothetical protein [Paraburkholderia unamae]|uniref:Uncharacterized protein n=1 Tax=Paraburkholderia unamae TaxID=219649 RepID=A0ABX5KPC3_9BURK|nr:hypothetical protein [Paraburkholderia unamae]PVX84331.1 hypothetical protein C7402_105172 [Paraburkholderia unamae]